MAGEFRERGQTDPVATILVEAQALVHEHVAALLKLYERIREDHQSQLARLREVEAQLAVVTREIEKVQAVPVELLDPQQVLDLVDLEDRLQPLRQQQEWLAEQLVRAASAGRKVQAVARHVGLAAGYLGLPLQEGGGFSDLAEMAEFQMLQAQEDERRRLARDLHDGPAQVLANAVFGLEWCKRTADRDPAQLLSELENIENDLRAGLDEVRQFIYDLSPVSFSEVGLAMSLRRYLSKFSERTGIAANLSIDPELERLNGQIEIGVFRIIQEALQNVRKHSRATQVDVRVSRLEGSLCAVVADNGVGFEPTAAPSGGLHFGMVGMQERARLIHGDLVIESAPGQGTRVSLSVPLSEFSREI